MKIRYFILFFTLLFVLLRVDTLYAAIDYVAFTTIDNGTPVSTVPTSHYFIAGRPYLFTIHVRTSEADWTTISSIKLTITGTPNIVMDINPSGLGSIFDNPASPTVNVSGGGSATCTITETVPGDDHTDFEVAIEYIHGGTNETSYVARAIEASVNGGMILGTDFDSVSRPYGITNTGITSVSMPTLNSGDVLTTDGYAYYRGGGTYDFLVTVTANAHDWDCIDNVTVTLPRSSGGDIKLSISPTSTGTFPGTVTASGSSDASVLCTIGGNYDNFAVLFQFTVNKTLNGSALDSAPSSQTIEAAAKFKAIGPKSAPSLSAHTYTFGVATAGITYTNLSIPTTEGTGGRTQVGVTPDIRGYYLGGKPYTFDVTIRANAHSWDCIDYVTLRIQTASGNIELRADFDSSGVTGVTGATVTVTPSGIPAAVVNGSCIITRGITATDFDLRFTFSPVSGPSIDSFPDSGTPRSIVATVKSALFPVSPPPSPLAEAPRTSTESGLVYGIVTAGVTNVTVTPQPGDTIDSNINRKYYLSSAATPYTFTVDVTASGHSWACLSNITLEIPTESGTPIQFDFTPSSTGATHTSTDTNFSESATISYRNPWTVGVANRITISYKPSGTAATAMSPIDSKWANTREITASATSALFVSAGAQGSPSGIIQEYGIISKGITITTDVVTGPTATQLSSQPFFLPNKNYVFNVDIKTIGHSWNCISNITLRIDGRPVTLSIDNPTGANISATASGDGGGSFSAVFTSSVANPYEDFRVTFTYTPKWLSESVDPSTLTAPVTYGTGRYIYSSATFASRINTETPTVSRDYGVCSSARLIINTPSKTMVNPWDGDVTMQCYIVYYYTTATLSSASGYRVPDTEIINPVLWYRLGTSNPFKAPEIPVSFTGVKNQPLFKFDANWFSDEAQHLSNNYLNNGIGIYYFRVSAQLGSSPPSIEIRPSTTTSLITCDKFMIDDIQFRNGGGVGTYTDTNPTYIRNIRTPGTQVRVRAKLQYSNTYPVSGTTSSTGGSSTVDKTIIIRYRYHASDPAELETNIIFKEFKNLAGNPTVVAAESGWSDWAEIQNPSRTSAFARLRTTQVSDVMDKYYRVTNITGTAGGYFGGTGQNIETKIDPHVSKKIYWDKGDPPGRNDVDQTIDEISGTDKQFTEWVSAAAGDEVITLKWKPLLAYTSVAKKNADFSTYRIYYKPSEAKVWSVIDKDKDTSSGLENPATSSYQIKNVQFMFSYDYYLTALDIFGNETMPDNRSYELSNPPNPNPNPYGTIVTMPKETTITISDGIKTYTSFPIPPDSPAVRQLVDSAIKIDVDIKGATQPDKLNIILKEYSGGNFLDLSEHFIESDVLFGTSFRIAALKVTPSKWQAFIPSENPFIFPGRECKFILETVDKSDARAYIGNVPDDPDGNPWTFMITKPPNFKPWPTRILNNIITDKDPIAYPAYYLTDDAYVTITAYDIKGRTVAVLLDHAPRKKGQNIKENGWRGTNRTGKKLGVGLYYVHIKAVRQSDGKVIIDKFNKVVMAR